jgi:phosphoribosylformylglycinamidine cyclo-ligase
MKKSLNYAVVGDNYATKDPVKKMAEKAAGQTAANLNLHGFHEMSDSRGESAYVWSQGTTLMASVIEGLGTKNLVADAVRSYTGKTYYDVIAHDTVATIINDLISVGAIPLVLHAYWAIENNDWLADQTRMADFIRGWKKACDIAQVSWGGGETPTLKGILMPGIVELGGSAVGIIKSKDLLLSDSKLKSGDAIILLKSSGINANGLSLARAVAKKLPLGYKTPITKGVTYGESLLQKTHIYAGLLARLQHEHIHLHYVSNITGHGLRKIMRGRPEFTYMIDSIFPSPPLFHFIQKHTNLSDFEMYQTFNMGNDYALFLPEKEVEPCLRIIKQMKFAGIMAGLVQKGERKVVIKPKNIEYLGSTLNLRG